MLDYSADVRAEDVGRQAAEELLRNLDHGGCVDDYLQDQVETFITVFANLMKSNLIITTNYV